MRFDGCHGELMRLLAEMPFLDRLDMAAVSGRSRGSVYESVRKLEDDGFVSSIPHGSEFTSPTRRFYLTAEGLGELAGQRGMTVEKLFRESPTSAQWMRILFERLDCAAVIYRLASTISAVASPIRFRWYRAMPMDAAIQLPDGRTIAVVRHGPTAGRTSFSKRLWRLSSGPETGVVLALMPDEVRLRDARRRLSGLPSPAFLALEPHVADANPDDAVWRSSTVRSTLDLVSVLSGIRPGGSFSVEPPLTRSTLPGDLASESPGWERPDRMMPALLKPAEKRVLDLLSDWPWISQGDLAGLMAVSQPRVSRLLATLAAFGLVSPVFAPRAAASPSPTRGWHCWPGGTEQQLAWPAKGGASLLWTLSLPPHGAMSGARAAGSCSGTWSTRRRSIVSSQPWSSRPGPEAGRSNSSIHLTGRRGTSGI